MSRSVAGFSLFLYVCVVSGQQYPAIRLKGTPTDPSIAIGVISGGNYPDGSFSIGYGDNNENGDGGPGADYGVNTGNGQSNPHYNGGQFNPNPNNGQLNPNPNNGGQFYPSIPNTGQNGGGYINGQNDIGGSYGGQNPQNVANNGKPLQNPEQKPPNPYDDNYNRPNNNTPVKNSASRINLFSKFFNFAIRWIF